MFFKNLNIFSEGEATLKVVDDTLTVTDRKFSYSSPAVRLDGKNDYTVEYLIKSKKEVIHLTAYFKITYMLNGEEDVSYIHGEMAVITPDKYTQVTATLNLWDKLEIKEVISYIIQNANEPFDDYFLSSYIIKDEEHLPFEKENNSFPDKCPIGAIRWDAYFSVENTLSNVSRQVSKTLSPNMFHSHAPFFAKAVDKDKLIFSEPTQEQFDKECELAVDAGIDYFAYCWYGNNDPMCYARRQHTKSIWRDKIKMCAIIGVTYLNDDSIDELALTCKEDFYLKILNRPAIFVCYAMKFNKDYIDLIRTRIMEKGNPNPYFIALGDSVADAFTFGLRGYQAISSYSYFPRAEGWSYKQLVEKVENRNVMFHSSKDIIDTVPLIICGLDFRPRALNPVSWMSGKNFAYTGTSEEIYMHAKTTLNGAKNVPAVLMYAWNEHDEGGWCCPTLTVDENGNTVTDENGNNVMDRSHLDAIKKAIKEYKNDLS